MNADNKIEYILDQALDSHSNFPNLKMFVGVVNFLNKSPSKINDFIFCLKSKISHSNDIKVILFGLELIEFTSCHCSPVLIIEYNRKSFLQQLNCLLADQSTNPKIKLKCLILVQFLKSHFQNKLPEYPNFNWYYLKILNKGIKFPPFEESPYASISLDDIQQRHEGQTIVERFDSRQSKLFKDLSVVAESIALANSMIDEKDPAIISEVMFNLKLMEKKILTLPDKLSQSKEDYLYRFTLSIIEDIGVTIDRHYRLSSKMSVPKFESKCLKIIKEGNAFFASKPPEIKNFSNYEEKIPNELNSFSVQSNPQKTKPNDLLQLNLVIPSQNLISTTQPEKSIQSRSLDFQKKSPSPYPSGTNNSYTLDFNKKSDDLYDIAFGDNKVAPNHKFSGKVVSEDGFDLQRQTFSPVGFKKQEIETVLLNDFDRFNFQVPKNGDLSLVPSLIQNTSFIKPKNENQGTLSGFVKKK